MDCVHCAKAQLAGHAACTMHTRVVHKAVGDMRLHPDARLPARF